MSPIDKILQRLGVPSAQAAFACDENWLPGEGPTLDVFSPIDGSRLVQLNQASAAQVEQAVAQARAGFSQWRQTPAPQRGQWVRLIGEELRRHKQDLGALVSWEAGKIRAEAEGEVQEMIDICDFAVGLSRQLYGLNIASERPEHRLSEQWHPLGPVACITAFNFPVAVWSWNAMIALVCGDPVIWKPSEQSPLTALACLALAQKAAARCDFELPPGLLSVLIGGRDVGEALCRHPHIPLVSATGSEAMGRQVAQSVAARLGRSLLELGGNNASIIAPSADLPMALRASVFGAVGTCGQRCTSLRRLFVHSSIAEDMLERFLAAYAQLPIGNPLDAGTLVGPLISEAAYERMQAALEEAKAQGGRVHGGQRIEKNMPGGVYVKPAIVEIGPQAELLQRETFAPVLYFLRYDDLEQAIEWQNDVPQGLSASIFTRNMQEAELFCSAAGADCGLVNVNIGTSGAEIGGAFGGEKATGGGRESGSDAWKSYMRRSTNTVNYSNALPLAQGIQFDI